MLPSSPRVQPGGLPSGPRSRSIGPSRQQNARRHSEDPPFAPSKPIRQQKSVASFPREPRSRSRQPPPSSTSSESGGWQRRHTPQSQSYSKYAETPTHSSRSSEDSTASSVSSLFERVRNGAASYASSFTSVEDSGNDNDEPRGRSWRKQRAFSPEPQDASRTDTGTGDGYTVWSRVAAAANSLTISVSKAWESNIKMYSGEETPPGEESRLTRALKSYHLEKVTEQGGDSRDLPSWLFSAQERELGQRRTRAGKAEVPVAEIPPTRQRRRFTESSSSSSRTTSSTIIDDTYQSSSASTRNNDPNRLRRLREAKRQAAAQSEPPVAYTSPTPKQRVGLPTGPGNARRQNL